MKSTLVKFVAPVAILSLSACSSSSVLFAVQDHNVCMNQDEGCQPKESDKETLYADVPVEPEPADISHESLYKTPIHFNLLNDYVEQMAMDLRQDLADAKTLFPIAVASFVHFDSTLDNADVLGNQIAEYFITELRDMGLTVNDHKITGNITVTRKGDFAFSRDASMLKSIQNVGYVLTGTMTKQMNGVMINARVVGLDSNMVVASTSKLIPNVVL